jgi:hypothetical protein
VVKERWFRIGSLAAVLFAINVVARLIVRLAYNNDDGKQTAVGLIAMIAIGAIYAVLAFVWGRQVSTGRWVADLGAAALIGCAFTVFVGPLISGKGPFSSGAGVFFAQIWQYGGFTIGGAFFGFLVAMAVGVDYRSRSLKRLEQSKLAKPRRVARR